MDGRRRTTLAPQKLVLDTGEEVVIREGMATLGDDDGCTLGFGGTEGSPLLWLFVLAAVVTSVRRTKRAQGGGGGSS